MPQACQSGLPTLLGWVLCGAPAIAVHDYGCIHEHVKRRATCAEHAPQPGIVGCVACWDAGHECAMTAQLVEVLP